MGGQGIAYGPEYLLDDNDFVFVTINYRLGILGFATSGDGVLPANNGMKDQVAALRWIRRNVASFGGDPDKVTITGMSAGASSVHYHMVSPMSKGKSNGKIVILRFRQIVLKDQCSYGVAVNRIDAHLSGPENRAALLYVGICSSVSYK